MKSIQNYSNNRIRATICIATYNGERYIKEQVQTILPQLEVNDELIISDDGSNDNTIAVVESFNDSRIKIYSNHRRHGFVNNFENALSVANGEYIFLVDQDDRWKQEKLHICLSYLQDYDILLHDAELIDEYGLRLNKKYSDMLHHMEGFWANMWKTRWLGCCMAFRRKVLQDSLPFPKHLVGHDSWISFIGLAKYKYIYIPDLLIEYRRHGDNASSASEKSRNSIYYMLIEKRFWTLFELAKRLVVLFFRN